MKTVSIQLQEVIDNFKDHSREYLGDMSISRCDETIEIERDGLKAVQESLESSRTSQVRSTLRYLFDETGMTDVLLPSHQLNFLQECDEKGEDFCIVVKRDLDTILILSKGEIVW